MTRLNLVRLAVVGTIITLSVPVASHAEPLGPTSPKPASDTLTKLEKSKADRPAPAPTRKLKARQTSPVPPRASYGADQPWETEFFVENDIAGRREIQLALASFGRPR